MKILVTGAEGQLGREFLINNLIKCRIIGVARKKKTKNKSVIELDITDNFKFRKLVKEFNPDVIINCAAITDVDFCETEPETAKSVNYHAAGKIAEICKEEKIKMVQISTDYVFDGINGNYTELSETNPIQEYGLSKLEGEKIVLEILPQSSLIIRTSVVFSDNTKNFVTWVKKTLEEGNSISIVDDQWITPTSSKYLVSCIIKILGNFQSGIINISSNQRINRLEMASKIALKFKLNRKFIKVVNMNEIEWRAKRPMDSSLNCDKLGKITKLLNFEEMLDLEFSI